MDASDLPATGVFEGVAWADIQDIVGVAPVHVLEAGRVLAQPGEGDGTVWIVLEGRLGIHIDSRDSGPVAWIDVGRCVGELAALDDGPRSAWVISPAISRVAELTGPVFQALLMRSHRFATNLMRIVARRVRAGNIEVLRRQKSATVDGLTSLHNRRWLDEYLPRMIRRSGRSERPLALAMFDIDHFKRLNDTLGHAVGDHVLALFARMARRRFRPEDFVVRYGGEEFTVILPDTGLEGAWSAADRLRKALAFTGLVLPDGSSLPRVTVSGGVAQWRPGELPAGLLARADSAMYRAKTEGRNRVFRAGMADDPGHGTLP